MNFKYYFSVLTAIGCMFILSSCENKSASSSEEPVPSVCRLNCPDSVLVYGIAKDGKENLSCVWHYQYDANGNKKASRTSDYDTGKETYFDENGNFVGFSPNWDEM